VPPIYWGSDSGSHGEAALVGGIPATDIRRSYGPRRDGPALLRQVGGTGEVEPVPGAGLFKLVQGAGICLCRLVTLCRSIRKDGPYIRWLRRLAS
jgi:hypothetical protein